MGKFFKILSLFSVILVDISLSSNKDFERYRRDYSRWTFARSYREQYESKRSDVPKKIDIKMPEVAPQKPETYFCTAVKMPEDDAYIVEYEPHARMQTAHHMLMFGCDDVDDSGSKGFWDCNEMGGTCKGGFNQILYAWAMDAPALSLPKDVGFHVGGSSRIKYIVLQVHYANVDKFKSYEGHPGETDHSGVKIHLKVEKPKYFAGIYLVAAGGPSIPPKTKEFDMNMACDYTVGPEMHPFAFRVHTHTLGYVVTGFRVRNGRWHLIGKGDPKRPQAFYHVDSEDSLLPGDALAARCTYDSMERAQFTNIGATRADEMCNFYMMYWYDPAEGRSTNACIFKNFKDSEYPADTNVPLRTDKKMNMKRELEGEASEKNYPRELEKGSWPENWVEYNGVKAGQIAGVAVTTLDIVIFHRGDRKWDFDTFDIKTNMLNPALRKSPITEDPVWFLDKVTRKVKRTWGKGLFYFPHGIALDEKNNMWFTDVGMHQVFKYSADGKPLLTVGEKFIPGNDDKHFCKPTGIAIERNGSFFVSDGYCNSRIMKFAPKGGVMMSIGHRDIVGMFNFPAPYIFSIPHSVSLDRAGKLLYVADRENGRVLVFDSATGVFRHHYAGFGDKVFAVSYSPFQGGTLYVINGRSGFGPSMIYGSTLDLQTKNILRWQPVQGFSNTHDIACDPLGNDVYVSEITLPGKLWKFQGKANYIGSK